MSTAVGLIIMMSIGFSALNATCTKYSFRFRQRRRHSATGNKLNQQIAEKGGERTLNAINKNRKIAKCLNYLPVLSHLVQSPLSFASHDSHELCFFLSPSPTSASALHSKWAWKWKYVSIERKVFGHARPVDFAWHLFANICRIHWILHIKLDERRTTDGRDTKIGDAVIWLIKFRWDCAKLQYWTHRPLLKSNTRMKQTWEENNCHSAHNKYCLWCAK